MRHTCGRTTGGVRDGGGDGGGDGATGAEGSLAAAVSRVRSPDFTPPRQAASPSNEAATTTATGANLRTAQTVAEHREE